MLENRLRDPVIGVIFDGTGFGLDGTIWGGEFLVGDYGSFCRIAHLRCVRMPGGESAIREPRRMGLAHLLDAQIRKAPLLARISPTERAVMGRMAERGINAPFTSSMGRLFDAVAALAGVRDRVSYEGQAAIELEWLATDLKACGRYPVELSSTPESETGAPFAIDTRPLIRAVCEDVERGESAAAIARRFHSTVVEMIVAACRRIRQDTGIASVVLSGGTFLNALLTREASDSLSNAGFLVYRHRLVPPNDGGLSLGQIAVAAATLARIDERRYRCVSGFPAKLPRRTVSMIC